MPISTPATHPKRTTGTHHGAEKSAEMTEPVTAPTQPTAAKEGAYGSGLGEGNPGRCAATGSARSINARAESSNPSSSVNARPTTAASSHRPAATKAVMPTPRRTIRGTTNVPRTVPQTAGNCCCRANETRESIGFQQAMCAPPTAILATSAHHHGVHATRPMVMTPPRLNRCGRTPARKANLTTRR